MSESNRPRAVNLAILAEFSKDQTKIGTKIGNKKIDKVTLNQTGAL